MGGENTWMIGFVGCVGGGGNGRIYYRRESMNCREDFEEYLLWEDLGLIIKCCCIIE